MAENPCSEVGQEAPTENNAGQNTPPTTQKSEPTVVALEDLKKSIVEQVLAAISTQQPARTSLAGRKRSLQVEDEVDDEYDIRPYQRSL